MSLLSLVSVAIAACGEGSAAVEVEEELAASFASDADLVTGRAAAAVLIEDGDGLRVAGTSAVLPRQAADGIELADDVAIVELGLDSAIEPADGSAPSFAVYRRGGHDKSVFTSTGNALEEWLLLTPRGGAVEVSWQTLDGRFVQDGDAAILEDGAGVSRFRVEADGARGASGARYRPRLRADGDVLTVRVEVNAGEERVLVDPVWKQAGFLFESRHSHTLVQLTNGKLLAVGGTHSFSTPANPLEIYDPATGQWKTGPSLAVPRSFANVVMMRNGKVLICGGAAGPSANYESVDTCETFDPQHNTLTMSAPLLFPQFEAQHALLTDGRVLIIGGIGHDDVGDGTYVETRYDTTQVYDPAADSWSLAQPLGRPRYRGVATRLDKGRVLLVGGISVNATTATTEVFDPTTNTWHDAAPLPQSGLTSWRVTSLPDGDAIVITARTGTSQIVQAYRFDSASETWSTAGAPAPSSRQGEWATARTTSGRIVVGTGTAVQGVIQGVETDIIEEFNPTHNTWAVLPPFPVPSKYHGVSVGPSGRVLFTGGFSNPSTYYATTRLLDLHAPTVANLSASPSAHSAHTATLLPTGRILVAGGIAAGVATAAVDVLNATGSTWTTAPSMVQARSSHTATLLGDGRVVVIGGRVGTVPIAVPTTEVYDGSTWSTAAALPTPRWLHTATLLDDGRVLVAGGCTGVLGSGVAKTNTVRIYDPVQNTWASVGSLRKQRCGHTATVLTSKEILFVGGDGLSTTAEVYDPVLGLSVTYTGALPANHDTGATATLLPNGKVLLHGGKTGNVTSNRGELYSRATNAWIGAGLGSAARSGHVAALLPGGRVVFEGGTSVSVAAEEYDPELGFVYLPTISTTLARSAHTATVTIDGTIFLVGGSSGGAATNATQRYDEGRGQHASLVPTVSTVGTVTPSGTVTISGQRFMGRGSAGSGGHVQSADATFPLALFQHLDDGRFYFGTTTAFSGTSAAVLVPDSAPRGPTLVRIVVNGVMSRGAYTVVE